MYVGPSSNLTDANENFSLNELQSVVPERMAIVMIAVADPQRKIEMNEGAILIDVGKNGEVMKEMPEDPLQWTRLVIPVPIVHGFLTIFSDVQPVEKKLPDGPSAKALPNAPSAPRADPNRQKTESMTSSSRDRQPAGRVPTGPSGNGAGTPQETPLRNSASLRSRIGEREVPSSSRGDSSRHEEDLHRKRTASGVSLISACSFHFSIH